MRTIWNFIRAHWRWVVFLIILSGALWVWNKGWLSIPSDTIKTIIPFDTTKTEDKIPFSVWGFYKVTEITSYEDMYPDGRVKVDLWAETDSNCTLCMIHVKFYYDTYKQFMEMFEKTKSGTVEIRDLGCNKPCRIDGILQYPVTVRERVFKPSNGKPVKGFEIFVNDSDYLRPAKKILRPVGNHKVERIPIKLN